jgi:hypothetical protein
MEHVKKTEIQRIKDTFHLYNLPKEFADIILEALYSTEWDWFTDCDGCTGVPDLTYLKYHPACIVHDYFWVTGRGGKVSDKIFFKLMLLYKKGWTVSLARYTAVKLAWVGWYKWKHKLNGNVRPLSDFHIKLSKIKITWK